MTFLFTHNLSHNVACLIIHCATKSIGSSFSSNTNLFLWRQIVQETELNITCHFKRASLLCTCLLADLLQICCTELPDTKILVPSKLSVLCQILKLYRHWKRNMNNFLERETWICEIILWIGHFQHFWQVGVDLKLLIYFNINKNFGMISVHLWLMAMMCGWRQHLLLFFYRK